MKTKIGGIFFKLLDKHFLKKSPLVKVSIRSTVKLSYSCTGNMLNIVKRHKCKIATCRNIGGGVKTKPCNCKNKNNCPSGNECHVEGVVYSAEVSNGSGLKKTYIGCTKGPFKKRFYNHTTPFKLESHRHDTKVKLQMAETCV